MKLIDHYRSRTQIFLGGVTLLLAISSTIFQPLRADHGNNSEPVFLGGGVSPLSGEIGENFLFASRWQDPDDDFVVDVTVRYRPIGAPLWQEVILDWVVGASPAEFETLTTLDGPAAGYEFQFRASDAASEEGPRLHITSWQGGGTFILNGDFVSVRGCLGEGPEQPIPVESAQTLSPRVRLEFAPTEVDEGEEIEFLATAEVDPSVAGLEFFHWCVERGSLLTNSAYPNFRGILYRVPFVPGMDQRIRITVQVGDSLGFVNRESFFVTVRETNNGDSANPAPLAAIATPPSLEVATAYLIEISLEDLDNFNLDATSLLVSDLFYQIDGGDLRAIAHGLRGGVASQRWLPPIEAPNYRLVLRTTDGNAITEVTSGSFAVGVRYEIFGSTIAEDGTPIPGVFVRSPAGFSGLSDLDGQYSIRGLADGSFTIQANRDGWLFEPTSTQVQLTPETPSQRVDFLGRSQGNNGRVDIDIKPGSNVNPVNPRSRGKIPVAILSSLTFNAPAEVGRLSLTFGRTGNEPSLHFRGNGQPNCGESDVNEDGLNDLVCHFLTQVAAFQSGDIKGFLRGTTTNAESFEVMDTIRTVGPDHDSDADTVADEIEDAGPNNGDANGDGLSDSFQENVTSFFSVSTGEFITLVSSPACVNADVTAVDPSTFPTDPSGLRAPQGLLSFVLESCGSSAVTVLLHGETDPTGFEYRRFGPTPGQPNDHWYTLPATFDTVAIDGLAVVAAAFMLQDGGLGDDDLTVDGRIVDPGGPTTRVVSPTIIPTLSIHGIVGLAALLAAAAWLLLLRGRGARQRQG